MKKSIILAIVAVVFSWTLSAQNYAVVNTSKIYQSLDDYNAAVQELDELATSYQKNIDDAFAKLEEMYQSYMVAKDGLTLADQQAREKTILDNEKKITEYQQKVFGTEGIIAKKQEELLKPFTDKVNKAITDYATTHQLGMVIDIAATSLPFYAPSVDITEQIIKLVK
ncbi:MAG: OmpH family outer membrane protein [Tidjanibacter sp.]|nr:OmpH family outer membrane protein [Tidjanibacter sp.]